MLKNIALFFAVSAIAMTLSCVEGKMDNKYLLTADREVLNGVIEAERFMEEGEDGAADKHVMCVILRLAGAVDFKGQDGQVIKANRVQLLYSPELISSKGSAAAVKGKFYKGNERSHHLPVVAKVEEVKIAP